MHGKVKSFALEIIHDAHGGFKVTRKWIRQFLRQYMNWTFEMITTAISIYFCLLETTRTRHKFRSYLPFHVTLMVNNEKTRVQNI